MIGYGNINFNIKVGESCGYQLETQDYKNIDLTIGSHTPGITSKFTGIYSFTSNLKHEIGHFQLREEF